MIIDAILNFLIGVVNTILRLVPDFDGIPCLSGIPDDCQIPEAGFPGAELIAALNSVIPVNAMVSIGLCHLILRAILIVWDILVWIYHQIWGSD